MGGTCAQASENSIQETCQSYCGHLFFMAAVGFRALKGPSPQHEAKPRQKWLSTLHCPHLQSLLEEVVAALPA